jgi:hypothetical protein
MSVKLAVGLLVLLAVLLAQTQLLEAVVVHTAQDTVATVAVVYS